MQFVGFAADSSAEARVHTIETWFSSRRQLWLVERLDVNGDLVGLPHTCVDEAEAVACGAAWLRAHPETWLVGPLSGPVAARAQHTSASRKAA